MGGRPRAGAAPGTNPRATRSVAERGLDVRPGTPVARVDGPGRRPAPEEGRLASRGARKTLGSGCPGRPRWRPARHRCRRWRRGGQAVGVVGNPGQAGDGGHVGPDHVVVPTTRRSEEPWCPGPRNSPWTWGRSPRRGRGPLSSSTKATARSSGRAAVSARQTQTKAARGGTSRWSNAPRGVSRGGVRRLLAPLARADGLLRPGGGRPGGDADHQRDAYLEALDPDQDVGLSFNPPGGLSYAGGAVYDVIQHVRPEVSTVGVAMGLSAAATLPAWGHPDSAWSRPTAEARSTRDRPAPGLRPTGRLPWEVRTTTRLRAEIVAHPAGVRSTRWSGTSTATPS